MAASDFFRNLRPLFEAKDYDLEAEAEKADDKRKSNKEDAAAKALANNKKAGNVKESAADFLRKYSDIIAEAEEQVDESYDDDDEDPDVKSAESVKGKDGKKQGDFEKGKKWNFDKADKKAEDKAAKKVKKDNDL